MISIESEIAKTLDVTEVTKNLQLSKLGKSHFLCLKHSKCLRVSALYVVLKL